MTEMSSLCYDNGRVLSMHSWGKKHSSTFLGFKNSTFNKALRGKCGILQARECVIFDLTVCWNASNTEI